MDNRSLSDELSKLFPNEPENKPAPEGENSGDQDSLMIESLKALVGNFDEAVGKEVGEFLNGKGTLLETTRTAVARRGSSAITEVAALLTDKFGLSSPLARVVATLLVRLFPSISKLTGEETSPKPKPHRKTKPKTSSSVKPHGSSKPKKRKTSSSTKPATASKPKKRKTTSSAKQTASSKAKKRKPTSSKKPAASKPRKRKTLSRTQEIPSGEDA